MVYVLLDLRRAGYGVRELVQRIEPPLSICWRVTGHRRLQQACRGLRAPAEYDPRAKIASLGLKVRNGCTYHAWHSTWRWISRRSVHQPLRL